MKLKRYFECGLPVTKCNLSCDYCYIAKRGAENNYSRTQQFAKLKYSPEQIGKSLTQQRLGGICFFVICGSGETMMQNELSEIIFQLLKNGHFVSITTNGTITAMFKKISLFPNVFLECLNFVFSLHYIELKRRDLLKVFFNNILLVKEMGASYAIRLNLYDDYIPLIDEIKEICLKETGEIPQSIITRLSDKESLIPHTKLPFKEYIEHGKRFDSPLFDISVKNFGVKRTDFCYAGDWSGKLNLSNGLLQPCHAFGKEAVDIFKDENKPIKFEVIGMCRSRYCVNANYFLTLGCIPALDFPSLATVLFRNNNYGSNKIKNILSQKLSENNIQISDKEKRLILRKRKINNLCNNFKSLPARAKNKIKRLIWPKENREWTLKQRTMS